MHGFIPVVCVDVEDAQNLIGSKVLLDEKEVELTRASRTYAVVKHANGALQKVLWSRILVSSHE